MGRQKASRISTGWLAAALMLAIAPVVHGDGWERTDGALNKASGPIGKLLTLVLDGGKVKLDRAAWEGDEKKDAKEAGDEAGATGGAGIVAGPAPAARIQLVLARRQQPVEKLLTEAAQATGAQMRSAMTSMGARSALYVGGDARLRLETEGEAVELRLQELGDGARGLEVDDDGAGNLRVMLTGDHGAVVLLQQTAKGSVSVIALAGGTAQARTAENWVALYQQDPAWMDKQVLEALRAVGVRPVLSPQDALVKGMVLGSLGAGDEAAGKKLLADLDSDNFATREQASKTLKDEYAKYRGLIVEQAKAPHNSPETAARLTAVMAAHRNDDRLSAVVGAFDLTKDPTYLVGLLADAKADEHSAVVTQLQKVTGQKFGDDDAAWRKWVEKK